MQFISYSITTSSTLRKKVDYLEVQQEFKFAELEDSIGDIREQLKLLNTSDNACRCINDDQGQRPLAPVVQTHNLVKLETSLKHRNAILQEAFKDEKTAIKDHIRKFDEKIKSELNNINQRVDVAAKYVQRLNDSFTEMAISAAQADSDLMNLKSNLDRTDASVVEVTERFRRMLEEMKETTKNDVNSLTNQVASMKANLNALFGCLHPWKLVEGLCLRKLSHSDVGFDVAQKKCHALGGKLVEPTTKQQVQALQTEAGSERFLIGVVRNGNGWVRSSDLERQSPDLAWRSGEPNNDGGKENCVEVLGGSRGFGYNDNLCDEHKDTIGAICEKRFVNF